MAAIPLQVALDAGVRVTVNTDNLVVLGTIWNGSMTAAGAWALPMPIWCG